MILLKVQMLVTITLACGVYHLLHMRHVHIQVRITLDVSKYLLAYFIFKSQLYFFCTAYSVQNFCQQFLVRYTHQHWDNKTPPYLF